MEHVHRFDEKRLQLIPLKAEGLSSLILKLGDENLQLLYAVLSNKQTLRNFKWLAKYGKRGRFSFSNRSTALSSDIVVGEVKSMCELIAALGS